MLRYDHKNKSSQRYHGEHRKGKNQSLIGAGQAVRTKNMSWLTIRMEKTSVIIRLRPPERWFGNSAQSRLLLATMRWRRRVKVSIDRAPQSEGHYFERMLATTDCIDCRNACGRRRTGGRSSSREWSKGATCYELKTSYHRTTHLSSHQLSAHNCSDDSRDLVPRFQDIRASHRTSGSKHSNQKTIAPENVIESYY